MQYPLMWDDKTNKSVNAHDVSDYYLQASSMPAGHQNARAVSAFKYTVLDAYLA